MTKPWGDDFEHAGPQYATAKFNAPHVIDQLETENARLRAALQTADDSIRHYLRSDKIDAALLQPHAVKAIREALKQT